MIVVSHRGPVSFRHEDDGTFTSKRGAGGVVSALGPLLRDRPGARWIAAAIGDDDRAAVAAGAAHVPGIEIDLIPLEPELHRLHYDVISNRILWFILHGLFDLPREPVFDRELGVAWDAYRTVNHAFAEEIAEVAPEGDVVLVQDLHFVLVGAELARLRPDLRIAHFTHTPFCDPDGLRVLPDVIADEIVTALAAVPSGFHTHRWAGAYRAGVRERLGHDATAFAATFGPDPDDLTATADGDAAAAARAAIRERVGDRQCIARADRVELSKNIGRGFLAYDELLETHPELRERVTFVAMLNPSREGLAEYRAYRGEVEALAARVNERWACNDWEPIVMDLRDDFPRSVAALQLADVVFVNPVRDGLNLVAMEGPLVNRRDAALCLSREAGAYELLRDHCVPVHPFDVSQSAAALHRALTMEPGERAEHARAIRQRIGENPAEGWLDALVDAARPAR